MASALKTKIPGMLITSEGRWRCNTCGRVTETTPVCAGAHDDGSPSCGKAVCATCASHCIRCKAPLCADDFARSKEGALCVQCAPPAGGREAYVFRQQARAAHAKSGAGTPGFEESNRAYRAASDAQRSMDDANRRLEEIERSIKEMEKRTNHNRSSGPRTGT